MLGFPRRNPFDDLLSILRRVLVLAEKPVYHDGSGSNLHLLEIVPVRE